MKKSQYIAPAAELIALNVEAPLLGASDVNGISLQSDENVDDCGKSSQLNWADSEGWE